jgi:hypothetical protein
VLFGCLGLVVLIIVIAIIVVAVNGGGSGPKKASSGSGPSGGAQNPSAPGVGSKVRDGKFQFTVTSVSHAKSVGDTADGLGDTAQGEYTVLRVKVTNIGSEAQTLDEPSQYLYDSHGRKYSTSSDADLDGNDNSNGGGVFFNQINPGDTVHGRLYFDLPGRDKAVKAVLHDSAFSDGVTVSLR